MATARSREAPCLPFCSPHLVPTSRLPRSGAVIDFTSWSVTWKTCVPVLKRLLTVDECMYVCCKRIWSTSSTDIHNPFYPYTIMYVNFKGGCLLQVPRRDCWWERARVKQHLHWYHQLLEWGFLVAVFNPGNIKFRLGNPNVVLWWEIYHGYMQRQENSGMLPWYQSRCWFSQGMRYRFREKTADCKLSLKPLNPFKAPHKPLEEMGSCCIFQFPMMWECSDAPAEMNRASPSTRLWSLCWFLDCCMLYVVNHVGTVEFVVLSFCVKIW